MTVASHISNLLEYLVKVLQHENAVDVSVMEEKQPNKFVTRVSVESLLL